MPGGKVNSMNFFDKPEEPTLVSVRKSLASIRNFLLQLPSILYSTIAGRVNAILAFARKHDRTITIVGSIVVLLTFIVRDIYSDHEKEIIFNMVEQRRDFNFSESLSSIEKNTETVRDKIVGDVKDRDPADIDYLWQEYDHVYTLANSLPAYDYNGCTQDQQTRIELALLLYSRAKDKEQVKSDLKTSIDDCRARTLAAIRNATKSETGRMNFYSITNSAIFICGWSLTLIGKISKQEEDKTMELSDITCR
jgi:hypothetical protein